MLTDLIRLDEENFDFLLDVFRGITPNCRAEVLQRPALQDFYAHLEYSNDLWYTVEYHAVLESVFEQILMARASASTSTIKALNGTQHCCLIQCGQKNEPLFDFYSVFWMDSENHLQFAIDKTQKVDFLPLEGQKKHTDLFSAIFIGIQYLLLNHKEQLQYTEEHIEKPQSKHKKRVRKGKKQNNMQSHKLRVYHLNQLSKDDFESIHRAIKCSIHCPAWGVRGHYRHYKNGKIGYVKPHIKGQHKGQYKGREYVLFPNANKDVLTVGN